MWQFTQNFALRNGDRINVRNSPKRLHQASPPCIEAQNFRRQRRPPRPYLRRLRRRRNCGVRSIVPLPNWRPSSSRNCPNYGSSLHSILHIHCDELKFYTIVLFEYSLFMWGFEAYEYFNDLKLIYYNNWVHSQICIDI